MSEPVVPEPDRKDWTWSITTPCPDCGYAPGAVERDDVPHLLRRYASAIAVAVRRPNAGARPAPDVWSALEYGCHVRDVCRIYRDRLALMRAEDDPLFANWNQDDTALSERYWTQDPATVAAQLRAGAEELATAFGTVRADEWPRPGRRSDGSVFTIDTFARYLLHDLAHHAWDVRDS